MAALGVSCSCSTGANPVVASVALGGWTVTSALIVISGAKVASDKARALGVSVSCKFGANVLSNRLAVAGVIANTSDGSVVVNASD